MKGRRLDRIGTVARRILAAPLPLAVLFLGLNLLSFLAIFGSPSKVVFCCDATEYLRQGDAITRNGLLNVGWTGYRSYLNYGFAEMLRALGHLFGARHEVLVEDLAAGLHEASAPYLLGASLWYAAAGLAFICRFAGRAGFLPIFFGLFCNPFVFSYVPYPLQEGQAVLLVLPLAAWALMSHDGGRPLEWVIATGLFIGLGWMVKSSYLLIVAPALLFLILALHRQVASARSRWGLGLLALLVAAVPVAPQIASSVEHSGSLSPYPNGGTLGNQFAWGWAMWRYDTYFDPPSGRFATLKIASPFGEPAPADFNLARAAGRRPAAALALGLGHLFASFNYANPAAYADGYRVPAFSLINLAVGAILYLGLSRALLAWLTRALKPGDLLIEGITLGNMAVLPFLAVEARFSILSFAMLSVRACQIVTLRLAAREGAILLAGLVLFSAAFVLIGTLMFQISGLPMGAP